MKDDIELPPMVNSRWQAPYIECDPSMGDIRRIVRWAQDMAKGYAIAAIESDRQQRFETGTALRMFHECNGGEESDPIERLRFYCSNAMTGQDWLDVEPFFDDVIADRQQRGELVGTAMPSISDSSCTIATFNADIVPPGSALYLDPQPAAPALDSCKHRIVDMRNPVVKSGYMCIDCGELFRAADHEEAEAQTAPAKQYYYQVSGCKAAKTTSPNCICWHDKGTGPFPEHKEGDEVYNVLLSWRDKPSAPAQESSVPECPYPCGWENLHKMAVNDGAYLAKSLEAGHLLTDSQRATAIVASIRLIEVCRAMLAAAPKFGEGE